MKWGAFATIEYFATRGLFSKHEVAHSYLVAHTLTPVGPPAPVGASYLTHPYPVNPTGQLWAFCLSGGYRRETRRKS